MSNPKERHYWAQLRAALTAGQWRSTAPAKAPNGAPLTWSELFRKFNKHCRGFQETAEVASHIQGLALLLASPYPDDDEDADALDAGPQGQGEDKQDAPKRGKLALAAEGVLLEERISEAQAGYQALKAVKTSNFDSINFALAYYAYALGNPTECLAYLEKLPDPLQQPNQPNTNQSSTRTAATQNTLAPSTYASSITSYSGSFSSVVDPIISEVRDGKGWAMTETFRSFCLLGMSHERLSPDDPQKALKAYSSVLPLFASLQSDFSPQKSPPKSSGKLDFTTFHQTRELWRWVERLIWRAVVLSASITPVETEEHTSEADSVLWRWLHHYATCSAYWPSTFRTCHRATVYSIHLRALVVRYHELAPTPSQLVRTIDGLPPSSDSSPLKTTPTASPSTTQLPSNLASSSTQTAASWIPTQTSFFHTARTVIQEYRAVLTASTKFPKAGERNVKVEEFVDLCVAVWETAGEVGEQGGWVIDILWWATRLTFNCSRVLRHMTRLLHLSGDTPLAKRTLKLYIQVVGKAYQASKEGVGEDKDGDEDWVDILVFGARMLCKAASTSNSFSSLGGSGSLGGTTLGSAGGANLSAGVGGGGAGLEGLEDIKEAGKVLELARSRLAEVEDEQRRKILEAKIFLAEGIYWSLWGIKGQEPHTRDDHLITAHTAFQQSILSHSTPSGYYHLSLSYARRGGPVYDLPKAIDCAGFAVSGNPQEVRYWHLLGLLLTKDEKWKEARECLERGAELDVEPELEPEVNIDVVNGDEYAGSFAETTTGTGATTLKVPIRGGENGSVQVTDYAATTTNLKNLATNGGVLIGPPPQGRFVGGKANGVGGKFMAPSSSPADDTTPSPSSGSSASSLGPILSPTESQLPLSATLLKSVEETSFESYPPSKGETFEWHLQIRMTLVALMEVIEGAEGAENGWLEIFSWVAERKGSGVGDSAASPLPAGTQTVDGLRRSLDRASQLPNPSLNIPPTTHEQAQLREEKAAYPDLGLLPGTTANEGDSLSVPIPITISPATPDADKVQAIALGNATDVDISEKGEEGSTRVSESLPDISEAGREREREKEKEKEKEKDNSNFKDKKFSNGPIKSKRSTSSERADTTKGTKKVQQVQQMLKERVHKSRAGITAVSKRIGHGVGVTKNGGLRRSTSTPDFQLVFQQTSYQASSIHSRRRLSSIIHSHDHTPTASPPPPPPPSLPPLTSQSQDFKLKNDRSARENRLLSDLWLMSAATFRRLGKIDQAKGSIQEAEVKDQSNPNVWVQLGLYYVSLGHYQHAVDTLQKALFISPDDVAATVHLSRLYLDPEVTSKLQTATSPSTSPSVPSSGASTKSFDGTPTSSSANPEVDLAAGILAYLTTGRGWDVPEVHYYLAKAYGMQGRKAKEMATLKHALKLSEQRGVRDVGIALGWCI